MHGLLTDCLLGEGISGVQSAPQHVPMVYNAAGMAKQIEACRFKENDLFVEYSKWTRLLDLSNVRSVLKRQKGYDDSLLIPSNHGYAVLVSIGNLLSQALPFPSRALQFVFRLLFPQDPLVDCNHSAAVDALQLARILRLAAEMTKEARERKLPQEHPQSGAYPAGCLYGRGRYAVLLKSPLSLIQYGG